MESAKNFENANTRLRILVDRKRLLQNTIHLNPRVLNNCPTHSSHPEASSVAMTQFPLRAGMNSVTNSTTQQRTVASEDAAMSNNRGMGVNKCVYLNPHFHGRSVGNSVKFDCAETINPSKNVYINPRKLAQIMQSSQAVEENFLLDTNKEISNKIQINKTVNETFATKKTVSNKNSFKRSPDSCKPNIESALKQNVGLSKANGLSANRTLNHVILTKNNDALVKFGSRKLVRLSQKSKIWTACKTTPDSPMKSEVPIFKYPNLQVKNVGRSTYPRMSLLQQSQIPSTNSVEKNSLSLSTKYRLRWNAAQSVQTKQKLPIKPNHFTPSKYKIDRRRLKPTITKMGRKILLGYDSPKGIALRSKLLKYPQVYSFPYKPKSNPKVWRNAKSTDRNRIVISTRKLSRIGSSVRLKNSSKNNKDSSQCTRLIRIGDVLYKTSRTKLTKSKTPDSSAKQTIVKRSGANKSRILYIRGNKFIMDASGKTLKCVSQDRTLGSPVSSKVVPMKRIDIGGITFVQKSSDVLVRTNTHTARSIVNHARNRSIALLTSKLRKNNQPCAFYRKFGKCPRKEKGTCNLVHDAKQISLCKKFLQGQCEKENCLLSHDIVPEKMPTCKYFLEGCCVREKCPYLHVKLNSKAIICHSFLQGYCSEGTQCKKRHCYVCPDYEKLGTCQKGKYCPYPHKTGIKIKQKMHPSQEKKKKDVLIMENTETKRYYLDGKLKSENIEDVTVESLVKCEKSVIRDVKKMVLVPSEPTIVDEYGVEPPHKRPKIGRLPSYIALDSIEK